MRFRLVGVGLFLGCLVGCVDPDRGDRALAELDVVKREAATREATLRAVEERQNALNQQMAMMVAMAGRVLHGILVVRRIGIGVFLRLRIGLSVLRRC